MEVFRGECNFRGKEKSSVFSRVGGGVGGGVQILNAIAQSVRVLLTSLKI